MQALAAASPPFARASVSRPSATSEILDAGCILDGRIRRDSDDAFEHVHSLLMLLPFVQRLRVGELALGHRGQHVPARFGEERRDARRDVSFHGSVERILIDDAPDRRARLARPADRQQTEGAILLASIDVAGSLPLTLASTFSASS